MYYIKGKNIKILGSKEFGLSSRAAVGQLDNVIILIKDRKSRIIMKDGRQILEQVEQIKNKAAGRQVVLGTNAPICGKTTKFFDEKGIQVYQLEK